MSFVELYDKVFDKNGNIKVCGREVCKQLILSGSKISNKNCGNPETGFMNVDVLKEIRKEV